MVRVSPKFGLFFRLGFSSDLTVSPCKAAVTETAAPNSISTLQTSLRTLPSISNPHFSPRGMAGRLDGGIAQTPGPRARCPALHGVIFVAVAEKQGKNQRWRRSFPRFARGFSAESLRKPPDPARFPFNNGGEPRSAAWPASSGTPVETLLHRGSLRRGPPRPSARSHESAPQSSRASSGSCRIGLGPSAYP